MLRLKQFSQEVVIIKPGSIITEWNGIASENMKKVSGNTVHSELVKKHVKMFERADGKMGSLPVLVAKTIVRAATVKSPKTRYSTGGGAKLILFM